jgi:hypothetical protein
MMDLYLIALGLICIWSVVEATRKYPLFGTTAAATIVTSLGAVAVLLGIGL